MSKCVGVVLSGCGVYDGSEIHEVVLTLWALDRAGVKIVLTAPNRDAFHVINHLDGQPEKVSRNVLVEAARIARGHIVDITEVRAESLDALIFPGGFGAAKNLSNFAVQGAGCEVIPEVRSLVDEMYHQSKPLGFWCISPVLAARILGSEGITLTIGDDPDTAAALEKMGAHHQECGVTRCVVDEVHKIVSTPCYMYDARISEVGAGIEEAVAHILRLA